MNLMSFRSFFHFTFTYWCSFVIRSVHLPVTRPGAVSVAALFWLRVTCDGRWRQHAGNWLSFRQPYHMSGRVARPMNHDVASCSLLWIPYTMLIFNKTAPLLLPPRWQRISTLFAQEVPAAVPTPCCQPVNPLENHRDVGWQRTPPPNTRSEDQTCRISIWNGRPAVFLVHFIFSTHIFQSSKSLWSTLNKPSESHLTLVTTLEQPVSSLPPSSSSSSSRALVYTAALVFALTSFTNCCHMPP